MAEDELAATIGDPALRRLHAHWDAMRAGRTFPSRQDFRPEELTFVLGRLLLLDVHGEPPRFRFRLHGAELAEQAGYDMTGRPVDDLPNAENRAVLLDRCARLVREPRPLVIQQARILGDRRYRYEALWLPFSEDGRTVNMLMCALSYLDNWGSAQSVDGEDGAF